MNLLKKIFYASAGAVFIGLGTVTMTQAVTVTLESVPLGSTSVGGGATINADIFLGWRFQLTDTLQVTDIGGHLISYPNVGDEKIFGAIVSLNRPNALPQGNPFQSGEVLASTSFNAGFPSSDTTVPLSITLNPGNYALVFGSGLFGASGEGALPDLPIDPPFIPKELYLIWDNSSWREGAINGGRFVVKGELSTSTPVPEPTCLLGLMAFGVLGTGSLLKRKL
jgi:hypothetical protein